MATSSVDGLISGLSTSSLISQLMQVESAGQTSLKNKVTAQQKVITSLQSINTKIAALQTASTAATDSATWSTAKATASSDAITVSAGSGASTGKLILDMKELAQAGVKTADVTGLSSLQGAAGLAITVGSKTTQIDVQADTPQGVVDAINRSGVGVKAALVTTEQGTMLQLTGTNTGAANDFTVSGLVAPLTEVTQAKDAKIGVGTVGAGGYTVTSPTNTFTNIMPNVSITGNRVESGITVTVATDVDGMASKVQSMVDAANNLLTELGTQSAFANTTGATGTTTTANGPLAGNFMVRQLQQSVLSSVSGGMTDYGSFKQLGIQTDRYGKLTFDKAAFTAAYQADPAKTGDAISNGLGKTLSDLATQATTNVTATIQSGNNNIRGLNDQIDNWDVRLQARQDALQRQFSNLEVALGKMKDQSSWLTSQIAALG